jgi:hypothetical protein
MEAYIGVGVYMPPWICALIYGLDFEFGYIWSGCLWRFFGYIGFDGYIEEDIYSRSICE